MDSKSTTEIDRLKAETRVLHAQIKQLQTKQQADLKLELSKARSELVKKDQLVGELQAKVRELEHRLHNGPGLEDKCKKLESNTALLNQTIAAQIDMLLDRDSKIVELQGKMLAHTHGAENDGDNEFESQQMAAHAKRELEEAQERLRKQVSATKSLHIMMQQAQETASGLREEYSERLASETVRADTLQAEVTKLKVIYLCMYIHTYTYVCT